MTKKQTGEKLGFEAEVSKLLHLMVHSVYSEQEIFLRELISNASDACDKLRYAAITKPALTQDGAEFAIEITIDEKAKTLTISDNGIGMNRKDLIDNLGTIARSGTSNFMDKLTGDSKKDVQLIGQFGVGFYSVFMVADKVNVVSRKAGEKKAWSWLSNGKGSYEIDAGERASRGTTITLHIKKDASEFLDASRLKSIVKTYSDHIAVPIHLITTEKGDAKEPSKETINEGSALWTRPKSDISAEQYTEFYRHVSHAFDEPAHTVHYRAEGVLEYNVLLFVPSTPPMDLFDPARKNRVKLYVKKVFITDETSGLLPGWLRFMRGVVDSEDLPLNISREMLQNNPIMTRISSAVTNKVLSEFEKMADKDSEKFEAVWQNFGPVIKEGIYEDFERREKLLKLARFKSTKADGWTSLDDYVSRMKEGQDKIYYITGANVEAVKRSPQLEGYLARDIEVLLLSDAVDDFWLQMMPQYADKSFVSITKGNADFKDIGDKPKKDKNAVKDGDLITLNLLMKEILGDKVADVRASDRLTDTAVCLVADEKGMDMHLEKILAAHKQLQQTTPKILEVNPSHPVIKTLAEKAGQDKAKETLGDAVLLLLDQARILEGEPLEDPSAFAKRLSSAMAKGLA